MARNRVAVDRETKREEIVVAAARLFAAGGFEATSMAALARAAGVAPNTVYWYFDDKDAVLVAVMTHLLATGLPDELAEPVSPPPATTNAAGTGDLALPELLLAITERFDPIDGLIASVHARAEVSPTVRAWHDAFHAGADAWLLDRIRDHLAATRGGPLPPGDALAAIPRIWSFAIEGMVAHRLPADQRRELCATLVRQLDAL